MRHILCLLAFALTSSFAANQTDSAVTVQETMSDETVVMDAAVVDTAVVDIAVVDTAVVSDNGVVHIALDVCDSLMASDVTDRYCVVYKNGKCGVYDIARRENVTDIDFDYLKYSRRMEMEGGYYSYFYWERGADSGVVGIVEADNHFMIITSPRKENGE